MDNVAHELAEHLAITNATVHPRKEWDESIVQMSTRITDTADTAIKFQEERVQMDSVISRLRQQSEALEQTFAEIDRIEQVVELVKNTYNKVAESVSDMEKSVHASTVSNFSFLQKQTEMYQPYFPPPLSVDVYSTPDLFPQRDSSDDGRSK